MEKLGMPLRTDALNLGTQNLVNVDTHIEKGSKLAKGQDTLTGVMSQFSSLMSVMEEDFSLMNEMQRDYSVEKSEVSPVLPEELVQNIPERIEQNQNLEQQETITFASSEIIEAVEEDVLSSIGQLINVPLVDDGFDLVTKEMTSPVLEIDGAKGTLKDSTETVNSVLSSVIIEPSATNVQFQSSTSLEPKVVQVPTVIDIPKLLTDEIVQTMNKILVETNVENTDDAVDALERPELPQFVREGFRLLDTDELTIDTDVEEVVQQSMTHSELAQTMVDTESIQDSDVIKSSHIAAVNTTAPAIGAIVASSSQVNPIVATSADGVSIQQTKSSTNGKLPKMPNMEPSPKFFDQSVDEKQEMGAEKMSFSSKLIQRLEMVIMDTMGRMDVEVAQETMGVQVKAIVPSEMISSLLGLEQDLQIALDNHGLDLNSFELEERVEELDNSGSSKEVDKDSSDGTEELEEKLPRGGMLLSRRV